MNFKSHFDSRSKNSGSVDENDFDANSLDNFRTVDPNLNIFDEAAALRSKSVAPASKFSNKKDSISYGPSSTDPN